MSYCGDTWITRTSFEKKVANFWRLTPERYSSFKQAAFFYFVFVQKQVDQAEHLRSLVRQPVLSDYSS